MKATDLLEVEVLSHLAVSACGTADVPTLEFLINPKNETERSTALAQTLWSLHEAGEVERVGVAFRITDSGRSRLNGGRP